jgi:uncharacterized protein
LRLISRALALVVLAVFMAAMPAAAQVSVTALGSPVGEDFDTLASSGTSSALPPGWVFLETGTNANATYTAGTGSGNAGDTYSFGATGSSERALGGLQSGSLVPLFGASFVNDTGTTVTELVIAYTGEQWRLGAAGRVDRVDFQYSLGATSLNTGTYTDFDALDFTGPTSTGTTGALDGNAAANRAARVASLPVSLAPGATIWIRWADFNATGADDALAVDDFSLTATAAGTDPTGVGAANPDALLPGQTTRLTVTVTPGSGPASTGLAVTVDLEAIGGSSSQDFFDDGTNGDLNAGDNVFSFLATVALGASDGSKTLPATITDDQLRTGSASIPLTVLAPAGPTTLLISQVYGGGGNTGATLKNDFIELYNFGAAPVDVTGWTAQYASAAGTGGWQATPLTGSVLPGRYYLVQEAAGMAGTVDLPPPDAVGTIAMAAPSGKVALVRSAVALGRACPASPLIVDLVGYGSANCSETSPTAALSNTTAALRNGDGSIDTDDNSADFTVGAPDPRNRSGRPPRGVGAATPASLSPGQSTVMTMDVTRGAHPDSLTVTVTCNLAAIGGRSADSLRDDGVDPDAAAGDDLFSLRATVAGSIAAGTKSLSCTVADEQARSSTTVITLIVEPPLLAIHQVQGPGRTSAYAGQLVATQGVVTGLKFNGFFIQTRAADVDADPGTSEGIFVFTNSLPSLSAGDFVKVAGTVSEFIPSQDLASPPITEIGTPAVTILSSGQPLPAPITLTAADTIPSGSLERPLEQLERFEGMRVHVAALRVVAPTQRASLSEVDAESTSNGVFYGVVDGVGRPAREPGIPLNDALPACAQAPCSIPRFDENPERLRVDSDGQPGGVPLEVASGALVSNLIGPLDFSFRTWTILPDPATPPAVSAIGSAVPVPEPSENEFTVGAFNMERFFDMVDDPAIGEPVLTETAFANRLNKASLAIRNVMRSPDVLGVEEMENLATLQLMAAKINADAVAAGDPDPAYEARLVEGNDIGGIDSGFLVKRSRVDVIDVTQEGKAATYINPNTGEPELLNDRPPLVLRAKVQGPTGAPFPLSVIVNHLRSLNGIDDERPAGAGTEGARVRAKRRAQAEFLARDVIQTRQTADPTERIVSVGDYNAFEVNDGYVDVIGTVKGTPTPSNRVVLASADLVNPDLANLLDQLPPDQRYSYSFDGNAQTLDHVLVNASLMKRFSRFHYARNDADFPESFRNDPDRPERLSDHDMPVAYFAFPGAPTLTLLGANPMSIECHTPFVDPGATASDEDLGDLTDQIQVGGRVDPNTLGTYTLTYTVSNGFRTTTITRTVNVVDTRPPAIRSVAASPNVLWPPNHRLVPVVVSVLASDTGGAAACRIVAVHSDEPVNGCGDGDTTPDWTITGDLTLQLRAERSGHGDGRVYTITVRCEDASGNAASATVTVKVAHDRGKP